MSSCNSDPSKKVKEENLKAVQDKALQKLDSPEITFDFDTYNYGEVVDGDVVEVDFNFTNTGKSNLIIFDEDKPYLIAFSGKEVIKNKLL